MDRGNAHEYTMEYYSALKKKEILSLSVKRCNRK
jgi:hypothetical protein